MKNTKFIKASIVGVTLMLLVGFLSVQGEAKTVNQSLKSTIKANSPIRINSDSDLKSVATDGDGSEANPYVIKNLVIDAKGYGYGIYIGNTTKYFLIGTITIRNVSGNSAIYFWNSGIVIYNATHGTLQNDFVYNGSGDGVFIQKSIDIHVDSCTLGHNYEGGVYIEGSTNVSVTNSHIFNENTGIGVEIYKSSLVRVIHNEINNTYDGIYGSTMNYSYIENNTIHDNSYDGLAVLTDSTGNTIFNNTIHHNSNFGIEIDSSNHNSITGNRIENNTKYGIQTKNSAVNITDNYIANNDDGLMIYDANNKTISHNRIYNNSRSGIYLQTSSGNNHIVDNTIWNNKNYGIYATSSNDNEIRDNEIFGSGEQGIYISSSQANDIVNNTIYSNKDEQIYLRSSQNSNVLYNSINGDGKSIGIFLYLSSHIRVAYNNATNCNQSIYVGYQSDYNRIDNNTAYSSVFDGIILESNEYNRVENNTVWNNPIGIYVTGADNNTLVYNIARKNAKGAELSNAENNTLFLNTFENNTYGLYLDSSHNNTMYWNSFINNTQYQAYDNGQNRWNLSAPTGGNYWSDHTDPNTPYPIPGGSNYDYLPLANSPVPEINFNIMLILALMGAAFYLHKKSLNRL